MAYTQKPGDFALFPNEKRTKDTQPNTRGTALIVCPHCGVELPLELAGWTKAAGGKKFITGKIGPKQDRQQQAAPASQPPPPPDASDPF